MPKRRLILGLLGLALLAALLVALTRPREPSYQGRSINSWLDTWHSDTEEDAALRSEEAIRHMGTNALPSLLTAIEYGGFPQRTILRSIVSWFCFLPGQSTSWYRLENRASSAVAAFAILGQDAAPARPQLVSLVNNPTNRLAARRATFALAGLGKEGLPPLMAVLTNGKRTQRVDSLQAIAQMGTNAGPAVPLIIRCLDDDDREVVHAAIEALPDLRLAPEVAVPALTHVLQASPHSDVRAGAMHALGHFARSARPALPAILAILNEADPVEKLVAANRSLGRGLTYERYQYRELRIQLTNALRAIAPEALTNAPPPTGH